VNRPCCARGPHGWAGRAQRPALVVTWRTPLQVGHAALGAPTAGRAACSAIKSFLFVFEAANRIVVEKPGAPGGTRYATYLFELESAVPVDAQARG